MYTPRIFFMLKEILRNIADVCSKDFLSYQYPKYESVKKNTRSSFADLDINVANGLHNSSYLVV